MRTDQPDWLAPPPLAALDDDEVHVWRLDIDELKRDLSALRGTLAPDEVARAERFVFERDRERFVVARGALRSILARYVGGAPGSLRFGYSAYGKPFLQHAGDARLHFNLSHSHELALVALTRQGRIGVDIEYMREAVEYEAVAASVFSAGENAALRALPAPLRRAAFFACWARKEAYVKARGEGLSTPLDQFDVSLHPGEPAALLYAGKGAQHERWSLGALYPARDYAAAVAVQGQLARLGLFSAPGAPQGFL